MKKLLLFIVIAAMSSCTLVPNRMFKTPKDYEFAKDTTQASTKPYYIQIDDHLDMQIFSNDGFKLIDVTASNISQGNNSENVTYNIDEKGEVKLPVIGRYYLKGLSIKEAEDQLQQQYSKYYKDPFVLIRITSRKAFVFQSDGGKGSGGKGSGGKGFRAERVCRKRLSSERLGRQGFGRQRECRERLRAKLQGRQRIRI